MNGLDSSCLERQKTSCHLYTKIVNKERQIAKQMSDTKNLSQKRVIIDLTFGGQLLTGFDLVSNTTLL